MGGPNVRRFSWVHEVLYGEQLTNDEEIFPLKAVEFTLLTDFLASGAE